MLDNRPCEAHSLGATRGACRMKRIRCVRPEEHPARFVGPWSVMQVRWVRLEAQAMGRTVADRLPWEGFLGRWQGAVAGHQGICKRTCRGCACISISAPARCTGSWINLRLHCDMRADAAWLALIKARRGPRRGQDALCRRACPQSVHEGLERVRAVRLYAIGDQHVRQQAVRSTFAGRDQRSLPYEAHSLCAS